jgi:hypothetical protein
MDKSKSSATDKSGDAASSRRINVQMAQNVLLIYDNSTYSRNTIIQLHRVVNTINTFTDGNKCIQFLDKITDNKVCMIISGSLGQYIVPRVHNMYQVDSIFIFCGNKKHHEQWTKEWSKIKGMFTKISPICESLKQAAQQCKQNTISICFMGISGDLSKKKT